MNKKTQPKTVLINEISRDFTKEDWQKVANEEKFYHLVAKLKELRKKKQLTQLELAKKANLPRETIVKVESGKRNATLDTLMQMAQAMGRNLEICLK